MVYHAHVDWKNSEEEHYVGSGGDEHQDYRNNDEYASNPSDDYQKLEENDEKEAEEKEHKDTIEEAVKDLKKAFSEGLIRDSMNNPMYYNIRRMQEIKLRWLAY